MTVTRDEAQRTFSPLLTAAWEKFDAVFLPDHPDDAEKAAEIATLRALIVAKRSEFIQAPASKAKAIAAELSALEARLCSTRLDAVEVLEALNAEAA